VSDLERIAAVRALGPAIPDYSVAALEGELHRPVDREGLERQVARAVELRLLGDLTSFDHLADPLRQVAFVKFDNALDAGLLAPGVHIFVGPRGLLARSSNLQGAGRKAQCDPTRVNLGDFPACEARSDGRGVRRPGLVGLSVWV
jgi:hypothetical protein